VTEPAEAVATAGAVDPLRLWSGDYDPRRSGTVKGVTLRKRHLPARSFSRLS
jgi:hypothetical protein